MSLSTNIRNQLSLGFTALIFIAIAIGVFVGARNSIADAALVAHTHEVISRIDEVEARLRDAESTQRGYLLTGDVNYLADYRINRERLPILLRELKQSINDNPVQASNVATLEKLVNARLAQSEVTLERYRDHGLDAARQAISKQNLQISGQVREQAQRMIQLERDLLLGRATSSRRSADLLLFLALLGIPLGLLVVAVVYTLLVRELRRRGHAERMAARAHQRLAASIQELQRHGTDMSALSRYAGMLQSCITPEEALEVTGTMLHALLPELAGSVYLLRASQDRAEAIKTWGGHDVHSAPSLSPDECWALRRAKPHFINDLQADTKCAHIDRVDTDAAVASACIPLSAQGSQLGFLFLSGAGPGPLPRIDIAEAAAEQLSLALSNLRLRETLRAQSIRDPLTGLYNRRYLEESLERELARCERRSLPLSLMMLDLDHFKTYNDTHGHAGGDALLSEFGKLLDTRSRGEDLACRYGGEEFTLILPETGAVEAARYAEHIRAAVASMMVRSNGKVLPAVTVSIGLASFPAHALEASALLQAADDALYRAKHEGRNRVVVTQQEEEASGK